MYNYHCHKNINLSAARNLYNSIMKPYRSCERDLYMCNVTKILYTDLITRCARLKDVMGASIFKDNGSFMDALHEANFNYAFSDKEYNYQEYDINLFEEKFLIEWNHNYSELKNMLMPPINEDEDERELELELEIDSDEV